MSKYASMYSTKTTPQREPIPGKNQVVNNAGGYVFAVNDWTRLERFLIIGSESPTLYCSERKLTIENADCVRRCLAADPVRTVSTIVAISTQGRTPKNAPAVFALALAAGSGHLKEVADLDALNQVTRTPTDMFAFVAAVDALRGWGAGLRRLVARWYTAKPADRLAYLVTKYRQRDGWTHRDVLRLSHPATADAAQQAVLRWVAVGSEGLGPRELTRSGKPVPDVIGSMAATDVRSYPPVWGLPAIIAAFEEAQAASDAATVCRLIREHGLVREHVPTQFLNDPSVWEALLEKMPLHALIRNLGKMSAVGLVKPLSAAARSVADKLGDAEHIRKSRLHPMAILLASKVYGQGHGDKGKLTWAAVPTVVDALDASFYEAFVNVVPTGKRRLVCLDVSGSMMSPVAGSPLSCREAAAAMGMIVAKTEPNYAIMAFTHNLVELNFSAVSRLADVVRGIERLPFGGTDCSLPMKYATANKLSVDSFEVMTDNETHSSAPHPCQALEEYRRQSGFPAKLVVQAFSATEFSVADPSDGGMLDVVGLDAAAPSFVSDFIRGGSAQDPAFRAVVED